MQQQPLLGRSIMLESTQRCHWQGHPIQKGKRATQVVGDPEQIKAQGLYCGAQHYSFALADYEEKLKQLKMEEEAARG